MKISSFHHKWKPPSLSELTPMFNMGLAYLGSEASMYEKLTQFWYLIYSLMDKSYMGIFIKKTRLRSI